MAFVAYVAFFYDSCKDYFAAKALYMSRRMVGFYALATLPQARGLPFARKTICRGGSCQELREKDKGKM